ncbi:MAG: FGGY-family carbohydrate kinase [Anaerolineaceae bacterium]|nr:FGGY-family carbohydrate kinase [Anaerolineaceae bacterium]
MAAENLLAIDNGTQSVRALLFNPKGDLLAKSSVPIQSYYATAPGLSEQDPELFWNAICEACQKLWQMPNVDKNSIAAVSLTTQRSTIINVDQEGKPLRPAIVWPDQRQTSGLPPVGGLWGMAFKLAGASETVAYLQSEAESNWIRKHQPEIWDQTHKYLFLSGYLTFRLVNRFVDSVGCQVGYVPFDYKAQTWARSSNWKWKAVPMSREILPDLVPAGEILGEITTQASKDTGIPAGLNLIAAAADKACEVTGSGCLEPHIGALSYGTTATINTMHKKYLEVIPLIPPYPSAVPGYYSMEIQIYRGYWMVNWFKNEFGLKEQEIAEIEGVATESLFDELVTSVPPGSNGLVLQPYWSPGLRFPGPEARGSVIGFSDFHTRAHLYRAILEGLAFALKEGADRTSKRSGVKITELRVAGGGSQSDASLQLTADIFGIPASRPHTFEASGLGAAINAAVGSGIHPDFETAIREMTHLGKTFEPNPETQGIYAHLYEKVYLQMYKRLAPLYQEMRKNSKLLNL